MSDTAPKMLEVMGRYVVIFQIKYRHGLIVASFLSKAEQEQFFQEIRTTGKLPPLSGFDPAVRLEIAHAHKATIEDTYESKVQFTHPIQISGN